MFKNTLYCTIYLHYCIDFILHFELYTISFKYMSNVKWIIRFVMGVCYLKHSNQQYTTMVTNQVYFNEKYLYMNLMPSVNWNVSQNFSKIVFPSMSPFLVTNTVTMAGCRLQWKYIFIFSQNNIDITSKRWGTRAGMVFVQLRHQADLVSLKPCMLLMGWWRSYPIAW